MMQQLIEHLRKDNLSIVIGCDNTNISNSTQEGDAILAFNTKGISTLLHLVNENADVLRGATVVDKVVGKAAAALLILGGVKELHALLISDGALDLLATTDIKVTYDKRTPHIVNREHTGWCPMESACRYCHSAEECLEAIQNKLQELKTK